MTQRDDAATTGSKPRVTQIAWVVSFGIPLVLLVLMCLAMPARGAVGGPLVDTFITGGPAEGSTTEDDEPTFSFSATVEPPSGSPTAFYCAIDNAAPVPCSAPHQVDVLDDGAHTFSVFAQDTGSLAVDPTPAVRSFLVDTGESGEEECVEEEGEDEEGEEGEEVECEVEGDTGPYPPSECLLRTARARVFTYTAQDKVRLVIRYTSRTPADVTVSYRSTGRKGSLTLGNARRHFAKKGLFRLTEKLSDSQMEKVRAARGFTVAIRIPVAPRFCDRYYDRRVTIKRTARNQIVWFQSDSIFGT